MKTGRPSALAGGAQPVGASQGKAAGLREATNQR